VLWRALRLAVVVGVLVPASAWAGVKATPVGDFNAPTYMAAPAGDTHRLFVVQQGGQIALIKDGSVLAQPFLDISNEVHYVGGEQGLLSMAFAPDYASSHRFYVYYTSTHCPNPPGCDERVSEFTADPGGDAASASSEHVLLTIPHPSQDNHNGGQLQFGPDGDLYVSVGDGGGGDDTELNAQKKTTLLGKLLRISPGITSYTVPAGNPFAGAPECSSGTNGGSNCPEIWAYGLRNPWRFSFDNSTGDLVIGDVGQNRDEEIDFAHTGQNIGANYGWPCYEGFELNGNRPAAECSPLPAPVVAPVASYPHPGNCPAGQPFCGDGIIGGYVMHDPALPSLNSCYVFGDLSTPDLQVVGLAQPMAVGQVALGPQVSNLSSFGVDASGHLYAADVGSGTVYRLESDGNRATDPTCPTVVAVTHPPVNTSPPQVDGPPIPSARLTCVPGTWRGANAFAYKWLRDGAQRATGVTYRPSTADIGHMLSCAVTATNADGSAQAASGAVRIIRDAPPLLYALRISPSAFRPARSGQSIVRFGRRGAIVSFRLDEPATVTFTLERAVHGSRINGRCRVTAHTSARPCTIWRAVKGSFRAGGKHGLNRLHFSGRINHHALAPGGYRLVLRARDQAGRASDLVRVRFSISR
jgi:glucose/arabinose dehydrogenase